MLKFRIIFGPIMIAVLLGLIYLDQRIGYVDVSGSVVESVLGVKTLPPGVVLFGVFGLLMIPGTLELSRVMRAKGVAAYPVVAIPGAIAVLGSVYLQASAPWLATVMILIFFLTLVIHIRGKDVNGAITAGGGSMLVVTYLGLMGGMMLAFRGEHAAWEVFGIIMITKSCDIGAYFTGRAFGKHKLIEFLSPKKTVEGLVGGVVLSVVVALVLYHLAAGTSFMAHDTLKMGVWVPDASSYSTGLVVVTGVLLALVGHAGDLLMSLFKRDAAIKDSGSSIPGFGGVLDVVDSPLLIAPLAYWLLG